MTVTQSHHKQTLDSIGHLSLPVSGLISDVYSVSIYTAEEPFPRSFGRTDPFIGADTMGHRGARAPLLLICRGHGGTDNRYETFDTLVNWALGSYLANKDTVM